MSFGRRGLARRLAAVATAMLLGLGLNTAVATPAHADASGCDSWSSFVYKGWPIPGGFLCHRLFGSGHNISYQDARFSAHSLSFCNWRIDFRYFDTSGYNWYSDVGPTNYNCSLTGSRERGTGWARYGLACAYLYARGGYVTRQCHNITA